MVLNTIRHLYAPLCTSKATTYVPVAKKFQLTGFGSDGPGLQHELAVEILVRYVTRLG